MKLYTKEGLLLLVQTDHLNGEALGDLISRFYKEGAKNVQMISTVTKKNRPGHILLIDTTEELADRMEHLIVQECGSSGWHRISTSHRHTDVSVIKKTISVKTENSSFEFTAEAKIIAGNLKSARPEYDNCILHRRLLAQESGRTLPFRQIYQYMSEVFLSGREELFI